MLNKGIQFKAANGLFHPEGSPAPKTLIPHAISPVGASTEHSARGVQAVHSLRLLTDVQAEPDPEDSSLVPADRLGSSGPGGI